MIFLFNLIMKFDALIVTYFNTTNTLNSHKDRSKDDADQISAIYIAMALLMGDISSDVFLEH